VRIARQQSFDGRESLSSVLARDAERDA